MDRSHQASRADIDLKLAEVLRLTMALSDQIVYPQIMERPIASEQIAALVRAAQLLRDHGVEWPPLLNQALHELAAAGNEQDGS